MQDINQHFEQLRRLLVKLEYPHPIDKDRICDGVTTELLPLLHHGLLAYSKLLASFVSDAGYSLYRQNDLKFTEGIYKLLRKEFKHNPVLQCQQFLTDKGFAKRKIQFVVTCLKLALAKHCELQKAHKQKSQSKIAWKETNLAKKVERVIKQPLQTKPHSHSNNNSNNNKKGPKKAPKMIKKKIMQKTAPKTIVATATCVPLPQEVIVVEPMAASPQSHHMSQHMDGLNDSLTADEIRRELPQPITIQHHAHDNSSTSQHETHPHAAVGDATHASEDEHESHDAEEKATELQDAEAAVVVVEEEEAYQSIQIPQHQYDLQLIPEYDPNKHTDGAGDHDDEHKQYEREHEHEHDEEDDGQQYGDARLDAYGSLMDIQTDDDDDEDEEEEDDDDDDDGHVQRPQIVTVTTASHMRAMQVASAQNNFNGDGDADGDGNEEEDEENDSGTEEENTADDDGDGDDGDEKHESSSSKSNSKSKRLAMDSAEPLTAMLLAKMEKMIKTATSTIHARLDLMEYRLRSLEEQQAGGVRATVAQHGVSTTTSKGHSLPSSHAHISAATSTAPPRSRSPSIAVATSAQPTTMKMKPAHVHVHAHVKSGGGGNMESFTESTIGSTSMPNSLTPIAPIRAAAGGGGAVISSTIQNYASRAHSAQVQKTRTTFPVTATSPFLPAQQQQQQQQPHGAYMGGFQFATAYNPMTAVLRYPQSQISTTSSESNGHGARIQTPSVGMTTDSDVQRQNEQVVFDGNHEVENTADFIADLRKMLHSTDTLLRNNREKSRLYDSNV